MLYRSVTEYLKYTTANIDVFETQKLHFNTYHHKKRP